MDNMDLGVYQPEGVGHFRIEGPDATPYLQRMVTNEIQKLPVGQGCHNALLDRKGMVLSLLYLYRLQENLYHGITPPQLTEKTIGLLKKYKIVEKLTIMDVSSEWEFLQIIGAKAEPIPVEGGFSWRDDFYKLPVWNIVTPVGAMLRQAQHGEQSRAIHELPLRNLSHISRATFDLLRIESGIPEYGIDIDETHILLEGNLSHCYKRQKGCYPGQEVIERILAYGRGRTPRQIITLYAEGKKEVPNAIYDPVKDRTLVMATVERKMLESTQGTIQIGNNVFRVLESD